jgi:hypothetical protein
MAINSRTVRATGIAMCSVRETAIERLRAISSETENWKDSNLLTD